MYALERISLANWYLVQAQDVPFHEHAAIIGPTGAGKSSLLDAIQTVLTGNHGTYTRLNSAAGESRSRAVREYCLGCVSDVNGGEPHRKSCETTVVLTFRDTETARRIAIGLLMTASVDNPHEETRRFVADGFDFRIEDFVERGEKGEFVVSHETMISQMRKGCAKDRFQVFANPERFVGDYLARMRPKAPPEHKRFLRAFGNAMQVKEIAEPTAFVRKFVLEPHPLDIRRVQGSIRIWRELEDKVRRLEKMLADIRPVNSRFRTGFARRLEHETFQFAQVYLKREGYRYEVGIQQAAAAAAEQARAVSEAVVRNHDAALATLREEVVGFRTALRQSSSAVQAESLAREEAARKAQMLSAARGLDLRILLDLAHLQAVRGHLPHSVQPALAAALELDALARGRQPADWMQDADRIKALVAAAAKLRGAEDSLRAQRDAARSDAASLAARKGDLAERVRAAGPAGSMLTRPTLEFMAELRRQGIPATALPEAVDILDDRWTYALECVLGANREAVMVPPEHLRAAMTLLQRNRGQWDRCRVVNTRKLDRARGRDLPRNSIASVVETDDPVARAFVDFNAGRFVMAEGHDDLERHDAAVTMDGRSNSGVTMRVNRDQGTILGKASRARALDEARSELDEVSRSLAERNALAASLEAALERVFRVALVDPEAFDALVDEYRSLAYDLESLGRQRKAVQNDDDAEIRTSLAYAEAQIAEYAAERDEALGAGRDAAKSIEVAEEAAKLATVAATELTASVDAARGLQLTDEARVLKAILGDEPLLITAEEARFEACLAGLDTDVDRLKWTRTEMLRIAREEERKRLQNTQEYKASYHIDRAVNATAEFCRQHGLVNPFDEETGAAEKFVWCLKREEMIEANELRPYRDRVTEARKEMEGSLKEDLLAKLDENFMRLDEQLKTLNQRLGEFEFVGQRYVFTRSVSVAMKPVHDLARRLAASGDRTLFSGDARAKPADEEMAAALAEIERLVTEDAQDIARFEDYREYFQFELNIKSTDDKGVERLTPYSKVVGKLSGGQREAPYYVAIGASLVSAYYPRGGRGSQGQGMGLVVFDEAFKKLDVKNTQLLMHFFREMGLQVVVAAPEEKRSSLMECVDSVVSVSRIPSTSYVLIETTGIGPRAREAMASENPVHRGMEAFRRPSDASGTLAAE